MQLYYGLKSLKKIGIILGFSCTNSCKHCITSSFPKHPIGLTDDEIENICKELYLYRGSLEEIVFSGGEPTLYLRQIKLILSKIQELKMNPKIRMVTNGHFAKTFDSCLFLRDISKLNNISISFDKFHEEFVSFDNVKNLSKFCKKYGISFDVNCTIETPFDFKYKTLCEKNDIPFYYSRLFLTGRAKKLSREIPIRKLPIDITSVCEYNDSAVYIPRRGFTWCVKNLTWNNDKYDDWIFSKTLNKLHRTKFYNKSRNITFQKMLECLKKKEKDYITKCDICEEYLRSIVNEKN
jgi:MoaA/NifB/PqqE/SkfB family radical SAM enzyme